MPIPEPKENEERAEYVHRCVKFLVEEGRDRKQAVAICYDKWKESK